MNNILPFISKNRIMEIREWFYNHETEEEAVENISKRDDVPAYVIDYISDEREAEVNAGVGWKTNKPSPPNKGLRLID